MTSTIAPAPNVFDVELPNIQYYEGTDPAEAHELLRAVRRQGRMAMGPYGPDLLGYDLVRKFTRDSRFELPRGITLVIQGVTSGPIWDRMNSLLISLDGTVHHRLRKLVARAFTPGAAERMRVTCVETINELVDTVAEAGECDVVADVADIYPVQVICALLGAPREDWHLFSRWAAVVSLAFGLRVLEAQSDILAAWDEFDAYLEQLIAHRRDHLAGDLLSDLIRAESDGDRLTHEELRNLALILLNAGTDTTRNQLAAAVQTFADHPEQWTLLGQRPELAPRAVEEVMRHSPVIFTVLRRATADVEIGGVTIPAGSFVVGQTAAANRDPDVYTDPDRFDIARADAPAMLTFGGGVHYCLGVHLARLELAEALRVMAYRMPDLRRTGPAPWKPITEISGPTALPVAFDARH